MKQTLKKIKLAEDIDIFNLFRVIHERFESCFIFESLGSYDNISRYTIIGFDPSQVIKNCPYYALRRFIAVNQTGEAFVGLVGSISYDAINLFEPTLQLKKHPLFDRFIFGLYTDGLIFDKKTNELFYFYYSINRVEIVRSILKSIVPALHFQAIKKNVSMDKKVYNHAYKKIKKYILDGKTFQCELGIQEAYHFSGNSLGIYAKLRDINPSPFMFYIKFGKKIFLGASPELLLKLQNGIVETHPLAGTIKRGKSDSEDVVLSRNLLKNQKEIAEHNMLIDLHRNDIGQIAEFGSIYIRNVKDIKKFSHVMHISSEVVGTLKKGENMFSALAANFPTGTLSGAPKIESIKIIDEVEPVARGPYGGAVGHFGFNGDCTFTIPIRSIFISGDYLFTQAASGIVYDSNCEDEYREVMNKLEAMRQVLTN